MKTKYITKKPTKMNNRYIKNWVTTLLGSAVIAMGGYLLFTGKVDNATGITIITLGAGLASTKYKKPE